MKIGMYGTEKVIGEYETNNDTLTLKTFKFIDEKGYLSKIDKAVIINSYNRYLIKDSLLIPLRLLDLNIPKPSFIKRDTIYSDWYIMSDRHVSYQIKLKPDSVFCYYTGSGRGRYAIEGEWFRKDNHLFLVPETKEYIETLGWICSGNKLRIFDKYLVGKTKEKERYMYMLRR